MNTHHYNKRIYGAMILGLSLSFGAPTTVFADTYGQFMQSAQKQFSARKDDAAYTDASKARELAQSAKEKIEADLLLAQILSRQNKNAQAIKLLEEVLNQPEIDALSEVQARIALAGALHSEKQYDKARAAALPALELKVPAHYLHQAQREVLRGAWGVGNWLTRGNLEALEQEIQSVMAQEQEAWPERKVRALIETARLLQSSSFYPQVRQMYELALKQENLNKTHKLTIYRSLAAAHYSESSYDKAYATLDEALKIEDLTAAERMMVQMDRVEFARKSDNSEDALKYLNEALKLPGVTPANEADIYSRIMSVYLGDNDLSKASDAARKLMSLNTPLIANQARQVLKVVEYAYDLRQSKLAAELGSELITTKTSAGAMAQALETLAVVRMSLQDIKGATEAFEQLVEIEGKEQNAKALTRHVQLATIKGIGQQPQAVRQQVEKVISEYASIATADKINAVWDAAKPFFQARQDESARLLLAQADALGNHAIKTYRVQAVKRAPVDVGGWQASGLLSRPGVADARFYPYSQQDAALFAVDVRTERPFEDVTAKDGGPGQTRVAMVYDAQGLHIYVHSQEPRINEIVSRNGAGASSLEMYFTPGTYNEPYFQWITDLGANKTSVYNWNSDHRHYRALEKQDRYFKVQSQVIEDGWGTAIFVSWEAFYDQLAMLQGKQQVWRFSMQRWDPAGSVTWGGRVHEMGRWGQIIFDTPSEELLVEMKRNLLKKSWAQYQATLTKQATYWSGLRGDKEFFQQVIAPMVEHSKTLASVMAGIDKFNASELDKVFNENIAQLQEISYDISDKRQEYLRSRLTSSR